MQTNNDREQPLPDLKANIQAIKLYLQKSKKEAQKQRQLLRDRRRIALALEKRFRAAAQGQAEALTAADISQKVGGNTILPYVCKRRVPAHQRHHLKSKRVVAALSRVLHGIINLHGLKLDPLSKNSEGVFLIHELTDCGLDPFEFFSADVVFRYLSRVDSKERNLLKLLVDNLRLDDEVQARTCASDWLHEDTLRKFTCAFHEAGCNGLTRKLNPALWRNRTLTAREADLLSMVAKNPVWHYPKPLLAWLEEIKAQFPDLQWGSFEKKTGVILP